MNNKLKIIYPYAVNVRGKGGTVEIILKLRTSTLKPVRNCS